MNKFIFYYFIFYLQFHFVYNILKEPEIFPNCKWENGFIGLNKSLYTVNDDCYYINGTARESWYDARDICYKYNSTLVTIENEEGNELIGRIINEHHAQSGLFWYGLTRFNNKYKWVDGSNSHFRNWNQTSDFLKNGCGAIIGDNDKCFIQNCNSKNGFICKYVNGKEINPQKLDVEEMHSMEDYGKCQDGWYHFGKKCYQAFLRNYTFEQADNYCKQKHGELVSIHSEHENNFITSFIGTITEKYDKKFFIGLVEEKYKKIGWSSLISNSIWSDSSPYKNYDNFEEAFIPKNCTVIKNENHNAGIWDTEYCEAKNPFICARGASDAIEKSKKFLNKCPNYDDYFLYKDNCYKHIDKMATWDQAVQSCSSEGGHLVTINDYHEYAFVSLYNALNGGAPFWMGFYALPSENTIFEFVDKTHGYISPWSYFTETHRNNIRRQCAYQNKKTWSATEYCSMPFKYICEKKLKSSITGEHTKVCPKLVLPSKDLYNKPKAFTFTNVGKNSDYCYIELPLKENWNNAQKSCQQLGGILPSLHSENDEKHIYKYFRGTAPNIWLGMKNSGENSTYKWVDETMIQYKIEYLKGSYMIALKNNGFDGEFCLKFSMYDFYWSFDKCDLEEHVICQIPKIEINTPLSTSHTILIVFLVLISIILVGLIFWYREKLNVLVIQNVKNKIEKLSSRQA